MADQPQRIFAIDDPAKALDLQAVAWSYRLCRALQVAQEIGLFAVLLGGPVPVAELGSRLGTDPDVTERLATLLCAAGWLYRGPCDKVRLTPAGREAFAPDSPLAFLHGLNHASHGWARWEHLADYVRTGERVRLARTGTHEDFVGAMHDYGVRGRVKWFATQPDLSGCATLLDVGGGPGTYSIALCQRYPELRAVVWDQPATESILRANCERFGVADRISFETGDWNQDPFGEGYDAVLLANVLHGPGYGCLERLQKARAALRPGGQLLAVDFLLDDDRNGPLAAAEFLLHVGAFTISEFVQIIREAGFADVMYRGRSPYGHGWASAVAP